MIRQFLLAVLLLSTLGTVAVAQSPPPLLHYQATLLDGQQEVDREISFAARIFASETGGQALWSEPRSNLPVSRGRLNVLLGSLVDFPATLFDGDPRYLEIEIDGEVLPRLRMASTPYALRAGVAAAVVAGAVGADGLAPDAAVSSVNAVAGDLTIQGANGATVNVDPATKVITISAPSSGGSDSGIFGIQNNDGTLQVVDPNGPTTTINVQPGSIGPSQIADGGVGDAQIAEGAVTARKLAQDAVTREALAPGVVVDHVNGLTGGLDFISSNQSIGISADPGTIDLLLDPSAAVTSLGAGVGLTASGATGAVTLALTEGGVGTPQLAPGAVTRAKIAPDAITSAMIVDSTITAADLGPDAAVRSINSIMGDIRFEADGGATLNVDQTTRTITFSAPQADGTGILGIQNTDGSLLITDPSGPTATIDVQPGGIGVTDLADGGVTAAKLAPRAVTGGALDATNFATTGQVLSYAGSDQFAWVDAPVGDVTGVTAGTGLTGGGQSGELTLGVATGGITVSLLADDAVTGRKVADGAIAAPALAAGAVGTSALQNGSVSGGKLSAGSVTPQKLVTSNPPVQDQVLGYDGSGFAWTDATAGDITGVTAQNGLTGGGGSGDVTVGIAAGGVTGARLAANAIQGGSNVSVTRDSNNDFIVSAPNIVQSITADGTTLTGAVTLAEGSNTTLSVNNNTLTIDAAGGGLASVNSDATLTGDGTSGSPLGVANGGITTTHLGSGAVTSTEVLNNTLTAADLGANAVTASELSNESVTEPKLNATNTATAGYMLTSDGSGGFSWANPPSTVASDGSTIGGDGSSTSPLQILGGGVGSAQIATGAVTTAEILNGTLAANDINASGAVDGYVLAYDDVAGGNLVWQDPTASTSSRRFKTDIETISDASTLVRALRGVRFDWTADGRPDVGLIAEEVAEVLPELVTYESDGTTVRGVRYAPLVSVLVEAVKTQQEDLDSARADAEAQQSEIDALRERLSRLEALVQARRSQP